MVTHNPLRRIAIQSTDSSGQYFDSLDTWATNTYNSISDLFDKLPLSEMQLKEIENTEKSLHADKMNHPLYRALSIKKVKTYRRQNRG